MPRAAAVFHFDGAGRVLLIQEAYGSHRYGPPGGRVEPGESPEQAARRELMEETGLTAGALVEIGAVRWPLHGDAWTFHAFLAETVDGRPSVQDAAEIALVGWFDIEDVPEPTTRVCATFLAAATAWDREGRRAG